ncbi:MAG: segregation/condensation protein A [Candidatus Aenigmarchaeota archaeon]|nr:segregation/condensation protein A [Candidatus Aenigmarchaeota archaeon]
MIEEDRMIQMIVLGSDWQEVVSNIVMEEGMNPLDIDMIKLTDSFMNHMERLKSFDFKVPARFILIAAILLRMKCELIFEKEEEKLLEKKDVEPINVDVPILPLPMERKPTKKVKLSDLISALNRAFEFREKKETKQFRMRRAVENLINEEEDIEERIEKICSDIAARGNLMFSQLVPQWERKEIVATFLPLLYLCQRGRIECEQDEMFADISIKFIEVAENERQEPGAS